MCAAREPRMFNGLCDTCCWFGHLSCDCLLQRDRIYSEGAHILGSRILFAKHANGNYVQATKVAHDDSPAVCLNPGMPATTVPSVTVPPAMAAAALRPGATTSTDINGLDVSLGHAHESNLRETAKQMGIRVTGTLVPCSECAAAKGIRWSVSRSTARRATKPLELLYGDLSGAMPASTGGSFYCFFIVDCYSNLGWLIFLKDKSADTPTPSAPFWWPSSHCGRTTGSREPSAPTTGRNLLTNLLPTFWFSMASAASSPPSTGRSATVAWSGGPPWSRKGLAQRGWGFRVSSRAYGFPAGQCTTLPCGRRHGHGCRKISPSLRAWTVRT